MDHSEIQRLLCKQDALLIDSCYHKKNFLVILLKITIKLEL